MIAIRASSFEARARSKQGTRRARAEGHDRDLASSKVRARKQRENPYSSQPSCCSAASMAPAKRGYDCGLLERRRLEDGASSPVIIHVFDVAYQIADDFDLVDILVRDYDAREPIFDHDH
jgi:hypothetical protein